MERCYTWTAPHDVVAIHQYEMVTNSEDNITVEPFPFACPDILLYTFLTHIDSHAIKSIDPCLPVGCLPISCNQIQ